MARTLKVIPMDNFKKGWNYTGKTKHKCVYCGWRSCADVIAHGNKSYLKSKGPGIPKRHLKMSFDDD